MCLPEVTVLNVKGGSDFGTLSIGKRMLSVCHSPIISKSESPESASTLINTSAFSLSSDTAEDTGVDLVLVMPPRFKCETSEYTRPADSKENKINHYRGKNYKITKYSPYFLILENPAHFDT